jgi:hypothetical protein
MKSIVAIAVVLNLALATTAAAQLGQIGKALQKGQEAQKDLTITDDEERQIGADISAKLRDKYGVVQDPAVHKYVTLVGTVLASQSSRSTLKWTFIVLDTDGVNAFRGAGRLHPHHARRARDDPERGGARGRARPRDLARDREAHDQRDQEGEDGERRDAGRDQERRAAQSRERGLLERAREQVHDRTQEKDADRLGVTLASQAGYAPDGLGAFLSRLANRDKDLKEPSGLFASHPDTQDRLASLSRLVPALKMTASATVAARYHASVAFKPAAIDGIAVPEPAKPAASGGSKFGMGSLNALGNEKSSNQTVSSAGSRGVNPDRDAKGGPIKTQVVVTVTAAEINEFKRGLAADALMDATAHPLWMPHALWGLALAAVAAALMIVARDGLTRRRLRFTLLVALAFLALHAAMVAMPLAVASHRSLVESLEAMLLALAVTNTIVTLVFNPWTGRADRDRAPSIIQDVIVVALIGGVAYKVFGDQIVGPSIGAAAALALGLQDQLGNLFAGLAIQIERPFRVGHWISLTNYEGRVVEVTWRATKIRTKAATS